MAASVEESGKLYREALDATRDQRTQVEEDIKFSDPSDPQQWDDTERQERERDPGGARPCLTFDQTGQYVQNVAGQIEQQPPAMHAVPSAGGADKKTAEQLDGFFRQIEHASRAQQHYARAATSQARAGVGYLIVRPEYTDRALNYQEPRISSEADPLSVVFDPWSVEIDGSDANFGFLLTPNSYSEFERMYGAKASKISFGDEAQSYVKDERESIITAEQWYIEDKRTNMIVCLDPQGGQMSLSEDDYWTAHKNGNAPQIATDTRGRPITYFDKQRTVYWCRMSGAEILTKETVYPASGIGIVPVYGYAGWANRRIKYCGIPRRARSGQQAYNFHMSEMRVLMKQAPKAPWITPVRAIQGLEKLWDRASVDSRAYLPYNDVDDSGNPIAAPQRAPVATNLQNHIQGALQAREDIQAAVGMYAANIGKNSNVTSGVAYDAQKQQGEASTANFPSNLNASLCQVGKLCMEMIPRLIDTKRQLRSLGFDGTSSQVTVDPGQKEAFAEGDQGLSINPNVGVYDVAVVTGASFATQRQEASAALTEMVRANPQMMPIIGPLWAQSLDFPNADKLAQVLTAMAPQPVQAVLNPGADKQPTTADLTAKLDQLQQALQEAIKHAQDAQQDADEANQKLNSKQGENEISEEANRIAAYNAETQRLKVTGANEEQIGAIVQSMLNQMLMSPNPLGDEGREPPDPMPMAQVPPMPDTPAGGAMPDPNQPIAAPAAEMQQ